MSKFKVINLMDQVFITTTSFLIIYAWINFYIRNLWTSFILSLIFTFACIFVLFYLLGRRHEKKLINKEHQKQIEEKFLAFRLMSKNDKLELLNSIISKHYQTQIKKESLIVKIDNQIHQITIATQFEKLTQFNLINLLENLDANVDVLKIICCDFESNLKTNLIKNLQIEIISKNQLYSEYFAPANQFPNCSNLNTKIERKTPVEILKNFFVPSKAKSYFLCGLILLFSSIILPYHYYYLIFGTTLLIFSIICKLRPHFKV